jgi:branched-chain amino acid transport system substrate-binding protein
MSFVGSLAETSGDHLPRCISSGRRHGTRTQRSPLVTVLAIGLAFFASQALAQATPGVSDSEIVIGVPIALTGPVRFVTEPYEQGVRTVFEAVNEKGGIHGRKIRWQVEDDAYQPSKSLAIAKKLIEQDKVFGIFGCFGTPTCGAVMPYAEQQKIPFFLYTAAPNPTPKHTFGLQSEYVDFSYHVARHLIRDEHKTKIAYFYQNDDLGEAGRIGLDRALKEVGLSLLGDVGYERGTTDFTTHVLKLRDSHAEAIVAMGTAPAIATAIKQSAETGFKSIWATYTIGESAIMQKLLGDKIDGLVYASDTESVFSDSPGVRAAVDAVKKRYPNSNVETLTLQGYAHAQLLVNALEKAGKDLTRDRLIATVEGTKAFDSGPMQMSFSAKKHTAASAMRVYQWQGGHPVAVGPWEPL